MRTIIKSYCEYISGLTSILAFRLTNQDIKNVCNKIIDKHLSKTISVMCTGHFLSFPTTCFVTTIGNILQKQQFYDKSLFCYGCDVVRNVNPDNPINSIPALKNKKKKRK